MSVAERLPRQQTLESRLRDAVVTATAELRSQGKATILADPDYQRMQAHPELAETLHTFTT